MYKITEKRILNEQVHLVKVNAPHIAKKTLAGQFIILRVDDKGERIPLTVADYDRESGEITLIFQIVGKTTEKLSKLDKDDCILDIAGPLGHPTPIPDNAKNICVIGGGVGCAIAYPQAAQLKRSGIKTSVIVGFRDEKLIILKNEFEKVSDKLIICTDNSSYGFGGFVTEALAKEIANGEKFDLIIAIGPVPMMRAVSDAAKIQSVPVIVSLNPIMIDGTGMCGVCRVTVGGETKYACVDGPDFDGALVDFDELWRRNGAYKQQEQHACRLYN